MVAGEGWRPEALQAHYGARAVYQVTRSAGGVRVAGRSIGESCLLESAKPAAMLAALGGGGAQYCVVGAGPVELNALLCGDSKPDAVQRANRLRVRLLFAAVSGVPNGRTQVPVSPHIGSWWSAGLPRSTLKLYKFCKVHPVDIEPVSPTGEDSQAPEIEEHLIGAPEV